MVDIISFFACLEMNCHLTHSDELSTCTWTSLTIPAPRFTHETKGRKASYRYKLSFSRLSIAKLSLLAVEFPTTLQPLRWQFPPSDVKIYAKAMSM